MNTTEYLSIIEKHQAWSAQYRAAVHVNADMLLPYYDIGLAINEHKTWGSKFIDNLAADIRLAFPKSKGYSVRNLKYMAKFAETYVKGNLEKVTGCCTNSLGHNIVILDKVNKKNENGTSKNQHKMDTAAMC